MKIFSKYYTRRLYRVRELSEIIKILDPWVDEVLYEDSPFLRQVASYKLRKVGSTRAPRLFKKILANEILRLNEPEDLKASVLLSVVESYRNYKPSKGKVDLVNWLSWNIPYQLSKLVTYYVTHPIEPFEERVEPTKFFCSDFFFGKKNKIAIICKDLELSRQTKAYYLTKEII